MITKALQARVVADAETRKQLWSLIQTFNDRVTFVLKKMLQMRSGRAGPELKAVFEAIGGSQNAFAKMEAIGKDNWDTDKLTSSDANSFERVRQNLQNAERRIGGWIDTHPMEWRDHFLNDPSLLRWRQENVVFTDFSADDLQKIEKKRQPPRGRRQQKATHGGKKRVDWRAFAASLLRKNNGEVAALNRTRREVQWAEHAQAARSSTNRFFDQERDLPNLSSEFRRKVHEAAFAIIDSHNEKLKDWRERHSKWLKAKRKFERENKLYMAVRGKFDLFERQIGGITGKRRRRWHHYLDFLKSDPALSNWRGKAAEVNPIPADRLKRIVKARRNRRSSIEAEEFFKANPELKALDDVHGRYEEEFVRRDANRRFLDGFALPPTFTLPHLPLHPCWYTFKRDASYRDLTWHKRKKHAEGTVKVMLPFRAEAYQWPTLHFRGTPRLAALRHATDDEVIVDGKGKSAKKYTFRYLDPHSPGREERPAQMKGIKLMFRPAKPTGTPYLVFTLALRDKESSARVAEFKRSSGRVSEGLVSCAADLVMRHPHLAAVSIAVATRNADGELAPRIVHTGFIRAAELETTGKHRGRLSLGPSLKHQAIHKQQLRKLRRGSRAVKGSTRNREFQQHVTNMGEDGCRKSARKLVNYAMTGWPGGCSDVLVVENLTALRADARRERGVNAALINWRRGHTAKWAKQLAEADGLLFREDKAYWTSQICSKCLKFGRRYTPQKNEVTGLVEPRFGTVESLFACSSAACQLDVNADLNASMNLHHVLYGRFPKIEKKGDWIYVEGAKTTYHEIEQVVLSRLRREATWMVRANGDQDWREAIANNPF